LGRSGDRPSPIQSGTGSDFLDQPGPVFPVFLRTFIGSRMQGTPSPSVSFRLPRHCARNHPGFIRFFPDYNTIQPGELLRTLYNSFSPLLSYPFNRPDDGRSRHPQRPGNFRCRQARVGNLSLGDGPRHSLVHGSCSLKAAEPGLPARPAPHESTQGRRIPEFILSSRTSAQVYSRLFDCDQGYGVTLGPPGNWYP
jgi:hypothetical protein